MGNFKKIAILIIVLALIKGISYALKFEEIHYYACQGTQVDGDNKSVFDEVIVIREYFMGSKALINNFEQAQCSKDNQVIQCATEVASDNFNIVESKSEIFDKTSNTYRSELRSLNKAKGVDTKVSVEANCSKISDKTLKVSRDRE